MQRALALLLLLASLSTPAGDWPQFLGPHRNGHSPHPISIDWPDGQPATLWSRNVGAGFSGPVVAGDRLLLHHRHGSEEIVECLDAVRGGTPLWRHAQPTRYRDNFGFDEGPRATPAVSNNRVFTFGAEGTLSALDLPTGRLLWSVATQDRFGADKGFFGFACSPLIAGESLILQVGGPDAGVVAFDPETGAVRWTATDHAAGYASPVTGTFEGQPHAVCFTREGLVVLDAATGRRRTAHPWRSRQSASVNAATPLLLGHRVFLSASYQTGAVLIDLQNPRPAVVWSGDDSLSSHYASVIHRDGFLYGFHGRQEHGPSVRCIEAGTGRVRWSQEGLGSGSIVLAADRLLILTERGECVVAEASPDRFRTLARAQILGAGTRAFPALAHGRLYARDTRRLVCLDLAPTR